MKVATSPPQWVPRDLTNGHPSSAESPSSRFKAFEYAYYLMVFYGLMGSALGIGIGFLGLAMQSSLAAFCILRRGSSAALGDRTLMAPILCAASFVVIQLMVHEEALMGGYVRPFVTWIFTLIIIKSFCSRPGFVRRFGTVMFLIGLSVLPFLEISEESRATLNIGTALAHPNALADWFGFCAIVFLIWGLHTRRTLGRCTALVIVVFSLFMIGLTVSRGALAAVAVAATIALRMQLKRSFLPALALTVLVGA
jgi:hypothetical protein